MIIQPVASKFTDRTSLVQINTGYTSKHIACGGEKNCMLSGALQRFPVEQNRNAEGNRAIS
jgi:hypothetical protein